MLLQFLTAQVLSRLNNTAVEDARRNLSSALAVLTRFNYPMVVMEVDEAIGYSLVGKFENVTSQL